MNILNNLRRKTPVEPTKVESKRGYKTGRPEKNNQKILDYLKKYETATYKVLADKTGLNIKTVYGYVDEFKKAGVIQVVNGITPITLRLVGNNETPEPTVTASDRILEYISSHYGETYSARGMARELDINVSTVFSSINRLIAKKMIPKNFNSMKSRPLGTVKVAKEPVVKPTHNEAKLVDTIDSLVWEFIKDTRSNDVVYFLNWLNAKEK